VLLVRWSHPKRADTPSPRRVGGRRYAHPFIEIRARKRRKRAGAYHPAVSHMIVQPKWVAAVQGLARCADQRGKERVVCGRARKHVAVFVINRERNVDCFDVMIRTDIAVTIWRRASAELGCSPPLKGQQRGRHVRYRLK